MRKSLFVLTPLATLVTLATVAAYPQALTYTPPQISAYKWTGSAWTAATSTATSGAITFTPPPAALYCFNSSLGASGQWVPADSSCFGGGGGSGTVTSVALVGSGTLFSATPGTAVTTSGTLNVDSQLQTQSANCIVSGPTTGSAATPTCRALVNADFPGTLAPTISAANLTGFPTFNQNTTGSAGSVTNALTLNNSNSGAASGTTYNGSGAVTLSANTLGAGSLTNANSWSAAQTITVAGAASTPNIFDTGSVFTGGSTTTTAPHWLIQPASVTGGAIWSTSGTGLGMNFASGFVGNTIDIHVNNGGSTFKADGSGNLTVTGGLNGASVTATGTLKGAKLASSTNCASGASPAVCGSAMSGSAAMPTGTNPTLVVNTTAVSAASEILITVDDSVTIGGTTCNSTLATLVGGMAVTARTAATSFTVSYNGTIAVNPVCFSYQIIN
jgi:hypothetical protein